MDEIFLDVFDIVKKIKSIDVNYRVFRNLSTHKFEIYYQKGLNLERELVVPYEELDYRTVNLINKTKIENADRLFEEIDKHNSALLGAV